MDQPCIAIVGATATGKTTLAISLAQEFGGEIINADSRQIYRGMEIGTAKPTRAERKAVPHWLVDDVNPDEDYSLAPFLDAARAALDEIAGRGRTPIVAGGAGQFIWALLEGWQVPRVPPNLELRADLSARADHEGAQAVAEELRAIDPEAAATIAITNVRRLIRAIEVTRGTGKPFSAWQRERVPVPGATIIGLRMQRAALHARIDARVDAMLAAGLVEEVRDLIGRGYSCALRSMSGIGYRQICEYLDGACSLPDAVARIKTETHRLARMQHTWFRDDDPRITWLDAESPRLAAEATQIVRHFASGPASTGVS